jgi:hypothetical protein
MENSPSVTTFTIMSLGDVAISSKVVESAIDALDHLSAMSEMHPGVEPTYSVTAGWRWSWEGVTPEGVRFVDTVRIY